MAIFEKFVNTSIKLFKLSMFHKFAYDYYKSSHLLSLFVVQESCYMAFEESSHNGQIVQIKKNK